MTDNLTRPIMGIENRTPLEVFDIMCDRIKSAQAPAAPLDPISMFVTLLASANPIGAPFRIEHDGFEGEVIGYYQRRDGKRGIVGQQIGTNIVHVYGEKWLKP